MLHACPSINRGRREYRVRAAPIASRAKVKKHDELVTTGPTPSTGIPCAMVLTTYIVLSPVTGLFCHRRSRGLLRESLTPASGCQDHTILPYAGSALVSRAVASTASRTQRSVTIAIRPSREDGMAGVINL